MIGEDRLLDILRTAARDDFEYSARNIFASSVASKVVPSAISYRSVKHAIYKEKRVNSPPTTHTLAVRLKSEASGTIPCAVIASSFLDPTGDTHLCDRCQHAETGDVFAMDDGRLIKCILDLYIIHCEI